MPNCGVVGMKRERELCAVMWRMVVTQRLLGNESCLSVAWIALALSLYLHTEVHYEPLGSLR